MRFLWLRLASWSALSMLLGLALLAAVALKGYELATEELLEESLMSSRWFLIVVVGWEAFFALWLLGGYYRAFPRTTHGAALLYFFGLFIVAMNSVLKGGASCPCFGKASVPPWVAAAFDLGALLLLAAAPLPPSFAGPRPRSRWLALAGVFSVFGLLSQITMTNYSTAGAIPSVRRDPRLFGQVTIQRLRPTTEDILALCRANTVGANLTADERLQDAQPNYGVWDLKDTQPWRVMELLVQRQTVPARWEKRGDGYAMVPAARFGKSPLFWLGCVSLLALSMMGLRWLDDVKERKKFPSGDADGKIRSTICFPVTRC